MGLRMAYWFGFAAVAGAFGGLIAFGVQEAHTAISNWKLLFIIEVRYFHSFSRPNRFLTHFVVQGDSGDAPRCRLLFPSPSSA